MSEIVQRPPHQPLVAPGGMDLHARDMTATFSADCPLRFVQWKLAELGQWLPVDGSPDATLGRLVETNSTGPLRLGFGGWRDVLLGCQFTNGRGELITAGGRTVKNVAGYDLTKFMVGGHGIFGRLVTITTRTYARPDGALLVRHAPPPPAPPDPATLARLLPTPLRPQWALLTRDALLCGYLADERTLAWYEANVGAAGPLDLTRRGLQEDIEHRAALWRADDTGGATAFRASVPPARLTDFVARLAGDAGRRGTPGAQRGGAPDSSRAGGGEMVGTDPGSVSWVAEPAFGIVLGSAASDEQKTLVREAATTAGGTVRFGASAATLDVSTNPAERQIIERLKAAFDPDHRLNPLPWQPR